MTGHYLGQSVTFRRVLIRQAERRPSTKPYGGTQAEEWKVWTPRPLWYLAGHLDRPGQSIAGLLVGLRTLQNGVVEWGSYDEPTTFERRESVKAALVAWDLRLKPCLVALEDLEVNP